MTDTPTLAAMLEWLDIASQMQSASGNAMMMRSIRASLTGQDANTLPLELLPEGWRIFRLRHRGNDGVWECKLRGLDYMVGDIYAEGSTPCAAFLAAVSKTLAAIAKINQTEGV